MPDPSNTFAAAILGGTSFLLTACAPGSSDTPTHHTPPVRTTEAETGRPALPDYPRTRKPGAAVDFSHAFEDEPELNRLSSVEITIQEFYQDGILELTATGTDALDVFQPTAHLSVAMTDTQTHIWRVSFQPEAEGLHYLHISAVARSDDGLAFSRSHAIRVEVGDTSSQKAREQSSVDGEAGVFFQAEETIE